MSILILNRLPLEVVPYADYLQSCGEDLYVLSDAEAMGPKDPARAAGRSFHHLEAIPRFETSGMVELRAVELHATARFRRIVAVSEYDLLRAGQLRDGLGIEGQPYASALAFRDKLRMKEITGAAGLDVGPFRAIAGGLEVLDFVEEHGLPIVIKPRLGSGSVGIMVAGTQAELRTLLERPLFSPETFSALMVERFVEGSMCHVNGCVHKGRLIANWPSIFVNDCRSFVDGRVRGSYTLEAANPLTARLRAFTERLLRALPTPQETAFHAEVFHTPDDRIILCEIASRVAGPLVPEQFQIAFGMDLREMFIQGQAGIEPPPVRQAPTRVGGELLIPVRCGILTRAPRSCSLPGVVAYRLHGAVGQRYGRPQDCNDYIATFVFAAASEAEMRDHIESARRWFDREATWDAPREC